jgi:hypothetical protein
MRSRDLLRHYPVRGVLVGVWLASTAEQLINALNYPISAVVANCLNFLFRQARWDVASLASWSVRWSDELIIVSFPLLMLVAGLLFALSIFPRRRLEEISTQ